jgi:hypothetical protein
MPAPANMIQKIRQAQKQLLNNETADTDLVIWAIVQLDKEIVKLDQAEIAANRKLQQILTSFDNGMVDAMIEG